MRIFWIPLLFFIVLSYVPHEFLTVNAQSTTGSCNRNQVLAIYREFYWNRNSVNGVILTRRSEIPADRNVFLDKSLAIAQREGCTFDKTSNNDYVTKYLNDTYEEALKNGINGNGLQLSGGENPTLPELPNEAIIPQCNRDDYDAMYKYYINEKKFYQSYTVDTEDRFYTAIITDQLARTSTADKMCLPDKDNLHNMLHDSFVTNRSRNLPWPDSLPSNFKVVASTSSSPSASTNPCNSQGGSQGRQSADPAHTGGHEGVATPEECTNSQLGTIDPCKDIASTVKGQFCATILWGKICIDELIAGIQGKSKDILFGPAVAPGISDGREGGGISELGSVLGSCNDGFVRHLDEDPNNATKSICHCIPGASADKIALNFCVQYLAPILHANPNGDLENMKKYPEINSCFNCFSGGGYWSSIGCIHLKSLPDFIEKNVFGWGLSLAALIAIGCISFAAVQMQLSQGNPEKIKKAQELLTSCIIGFILIIFSVFILRLLGVTILQIPGFK